MDHSYAPDLPCPHVCPVGQSTFELQNLDWALNKLSTNKNILGFDVKCVLLIYLVATRDTTSSVKTRECSS